MFKVSLDSVWDFAVKIATQRHEQKKGYKSHLKLSDNYELVGVLGELTFSLIVQEKMDVVLREFGDDGFDFNKINIKTSEEHKAKHLIEFKGKKFDGFYVFVVVNLKEKYGYVSGFISSEEFRDVAEEVDFGYGPRLAVPLCLLHEYTPKSPLVLNNIYKE